MGRPPIGKIAMTAAERVQRYRLKHAKAAPVTKHNEIDDGAKDREIVVLKARIAELEAENTSLKSAASAKPTKPQSGPEPLPKTWAEVEARKAALDADPVYKLKIENASLRERLKKAQRPPREQSDIEKALRTEIRSLKAAILLQAEVWHNRGVIMPKRDRMTIVKALHSDHEPNPARKALLDKALGVFNGLFDSRKACETP
jgi:hypothetical protein